METDISTFEELNLSKPIIDALNHMDFECPTPIQALCIPKIMNGTDLTGQAQTGTGKTAAFGIPIIEAVDPSDKNVQALVLCPTRELAIQVTGEIVKLGQYVDNLNVVPVYGGQPISRQLKALKRGAQVVVGTPGRVIDHLNRGTLKLGELNQVILDEADEMLNMGFREDIEKILSYAQHTHQTVMFSATMSGPIKDIMNKYMNDPESVRVDKKVITAEGVDQYVVEVRDSVRTEAICRLMDYNNFNLALVFCNTKKQTEQVAQELQARGYSSDFLNGDMSQALRDKVMNKFRKGDIDILVATDVAARGIDVEDIDVVFNYDIPQDTEYYVHRVGRTGRAGKEGVSITFSAGRKNKRLKTMEKQNKTKLKPMTLPSVAEVRESRISGYLNEIIDTLEHGGLRNYIEQIESIADERFTHAEIAAALLKKQVERTEDGFTEAADTPKNSKAKKTNGQARTGMIRVKLNVGKKHNIRPGHIVGAIAGETGITGDLIGEIEIKKNMTFVDVPDDVAEDVVKIMNKNHINGNRLEVKKV